MEAHQHGPGILRPEALFHDPRPYAPARAHLRYFFEKIDMGIPEKGEPAGKFVDFQPPFDSFLDIGNAVIDRESKFLNGSRSGFPDVVTAYADGVPAGHLPGSELNRIGYQSQARLRRKH